MSEGHNAEKDHEKDELASLIVTPKEGEDPEERADSTIDKLYDVFAASARRWEMIVYPSLIAFIILAVYGFYLIYSLTTDVSKVVKHMEVISTRMVQISGDMSTLNTNMGTATKNIASMANNMQLMQQDINTQMVSIQAMSASVGNINQSVQLMTASMNQMRHDLSIMNHSVSRPMNFMNSFMPW